MGWVIREVSFPWNALDEEGTYNRRKAKPVQTFHEKRTREALNSLFRGPARCSTQVYFAVLNTDE
ncbi:MAG: hypothetical protein KTR25_18050 [Myxococcales bacterium]|nr:hypothetical protein [Myxococcales bacterium]